MDLIFREDICYAGPKMCIILFIEEKVRIHLEDIHRLAYAEFLCTMEYIMDRNLHRMEYS